MSLDEKVGQLFVYAAHGVFMNEQSPAYRQLERQVRENKVGGIIWFVSNVYETAWLTDRLQKQASIPLLVSADIEAGVGMRFTDTTYWPSAMAMAATGDPSLAEKAGRIAAREVSALGINHILAPVADVNVNPDNPVINTRSFGEDPHDVGRFVAAFVRGVQSERVLATAKHFPGHGDTSVDSHRSLPVLNVDRARLDRVELVPFRAAIDAGVASVMMGHLAVPSIDATPAPVRVLTDARVDTPYTDDDSEIEKRGTMPASLSRAAIVDLLRRDLGFDGLVVSDAFDMGGLVAHFDAGEAAVRGIEAGEDMILKSPNTDAAIKAVKEAVRSGRIPESRIDESVRRILEAKRRVHMGVGTQQEIFRGLDAAEHKEVAQEIGRRAVTLVREAGGALPLQKTQRVALIVVSDFPELANPLPGVEGDLRRRGVLTQTFLLDGRARAEDAQKVLDGVRGADVVLLALAIRAKSGAGHIAVPEVARNVVAQIADKTVAVAFGSPYVIRDLPSLRTYLCAYSIQPVMQAAAMRALFGEAPISGKLPVTIPGMHARGEGIQRAQR